MANTTGMAEQSAWFKQYEAQAGGAKNASNSKKGILVIVPLLVLGGMMAMMIKNGALQNEQTKGGVYLLGGICVFLILMVLILTSKSKKTDAAGITRKDLDALLKTSQDAADFDAQMNATPVFRVANKDGGMIFATKDYIGTKFNFMGNETYRFIRISSISVLHTVKNGNGRCDVEFRKGSSDSDVLLTWFADNQGKVEELKKCLTSINLNMDAF